MNVKAEAYQEYNQAAVVDKLLTSMPEVVRALAAPLEKIDKITVVSTGNAETTGMHKVTADLAQVAAQVPTLFESLSGMKHGRAALQGARHRGRELPNPSAGVR